MTDAQAALTEIRELSARVAEHHTDHISTHYEGCFVFHAGCLAHVIHTMCVEVSW